TVSGSIAGPALKLKTRAMSAASGFVVVDRFDPREPAEALARLEANQSDSLGVAADDGNIGDRRAHQRAVRADQHDFVVLHDLQCTDRLAVALRRLYGDNALAAAALHGELAHLRALAEAVLGGGEQLALPHDSERDHLVLTRQPDAAY